MLQRMYYTYSKAFKALTINQNKQQAAIIGGWIINITQEAILSWEKDAQNSLRFPENKKWNSKDRNARFKYLLGAPSVLS